MKIVLDYSIFHNFAGFETFLLLCRNRDGEEKVVRIESFSLFSLNILLKETVIKISSNHFYKKECPIHWYSKTLCLILITNYRDLCLQSLEIIFNCTVLFQKPIKTIRQLPNY